MTKCTAMWLNDIFKAFSCQCTLQQKEEGDEALIKAFYRSSGLVMTDSRNRGKLFTASAVIQDLIIS